MSGNPVVQCCVGVSEWPCVIYRLQSTVVNFSRLTAGNV